MDNYDLEEYKTLRNEIERAQSDILKIMEFGLTTVCALLAFAYSQFVIDYRWLYLFIPQVILFSVVLLIAQKIRAGWKIGRYIQIYLEPKLGLNWERVSLIIRERSTKKKVTFAWSSSLVFLFIQIICVALSLLELQKQLQIVNIGVWVILTVIVACGLIFEIRSVGDANEPEEFKELYQRCQQSDAESKTTAPKTKA